MNVFLDRPWLLVVLAVAGVLILTGLRTRALRSLAGRRGAFWAALALCLWGGVWSGSRAEAQEKAGATTAGVQADGQRQGVASEAAVPGLDLPPELAREGRWQAFKALWKKLDAAGRKGTDGDGEMGGMNGITTSEERHALTQELATVLQCEPQALLSLDKYDGWSRTGGDGGLACRLSVPTRILAEVVLARIWALGPDSTMMMHMLPAPETLYRNRLRAGLQRRFETVVRLKEQGKLSLEEFASAMVKMEEQVYQIAVFHTVESVLGLALFDARLPGYDYTGRFPIRREVPGEAPKDDYLGEANLWLEGARKWCEEQSARLGQECNQESNDALKVVELACVVAQESFEALRLERPRIRKLLEALEE